MLMSLRALGLKLSMSRTLGDVPPSVDALSRDAHQMDLNNKLFMSKIYM